ncbi:putative acetyltransferase [Desulfosporosinus orientis DSM 765]|uniref:Putative acetyltransferase n=1 Tax=Desulfosporosinus orientis (strain ATCC 19365 / DSM 765 / NCIMB 8382 / VKM B-1628 / Singapore I) TaxID=768706 RepID=G7WDP6_DESOD|nr:GNAT family N-acetyltransferase [Desulfosporosinus orientis]AET68371.1 putative acetyltransferase [Desulfosporosinus orientis DSM 765]
MYKIRLSQRGDILRQKEIWKLCFGDSDDFIDFYYAQRYKEEETAVLLHNNEIITMLTMIPVKTVFPDKRMVNTAMLYAVATHPSHRNKGFAGQLLNFSNQYLKDRKIELSVLVPANRKLFDYYPKQGYEEGFYIQETILNRESIDRMSVPKPYHCEISAISSKEYNQRRTERLYGRFYISYADEDVDYQKKLSQSSGTDIYGINIENIEGCFAAERISSEKLFIKEILIPENLLNLAIKQIAKLLPAEEYVLRTPPYLGNYLGGSIRAFGMYRVLSKSDLRITSKDLGYLGFAFD